MTLLVPLGTETAGWTVTIDGRTYRPPLLDSSGRFRVALDLPALVAPTTVKNGQKAITTAGSAEQLADVSCLSVSIKALEGNSGLLYLGDSGVDSSNGRELEAGESVELMIDNLNRLYADVAVNGEGLSYLAVL